MGRRRKREEAPLSLFSFQDIMACLTGILIMVALLLAIDGLSDTMNATPGKDGSPDPAEAAARSAELRERVAILQRTIDDRRGGKDVAKGEVDILDDRVKQLAQEAERARREAEEASARRQAMTKDADDAMRQLQELRERLSSARKASQAQAVRERVRFKPGMRFPKSPVFVEALRDRIVLGELDAERTPVLVATLADPDAEARLVGALGPRLPDTAYLVFVVHEDAIPRFEQLRSRMIRRGYDVGWQLWKGEPASMLDGAAETAGGAGGAPAGAPAAKDGAP
ncbi:MAG: hypothetical protein ACKOEL_05195 [Planctomycetota bacterium]